MLRNFIKKQLHRYLLDDIIPTRIIYPLRKIKNYQFRLLIYIVIMPIIILLLPLSKAHTKFMIYRVTKNEYTLKFKHKETKVCFYIPLFLNDCIQSIIFKFKSFFEVRELDYITPKYIKSGSIIIDIGANIGNHTIYFSKIAQAKQVIAFEPVKSTYEMLYKNIKLNTLTNVTLYNKALGRNNSKADIKYFDEKNIGATQLEYDENGGIDVVSLDSLEINVKVDFLKIDVEGFEYDVLFGSKKTILKNKPIIFIEIFNENMLKVNELLEYYGYKLKEKISSDLFIYQSNV